VREGHLQYLQKLQADLAGKEESEEVVSLTRAAEEWLARNDSISCELGIWYPVLQAILSGRKNHQSLMVSITYYSISCAILYAILYYDVVCDIVYDKAILCTISYTTSHTISYTILTC
jgi:hypothetical protein